jgi:hypothetical protein
VLGIIGKGVFSSVIKCVEEGTDGGDADGASGETNGNGVGGRIVAMKIIRNNEVMAKAGRAADELRGQLESAMSK